MVLLALFATAAHAASERTVRELLHEERTTTMFVDALDASGLPTAIDPDIPLLLFVPTDTALRDEGSAFLLAEAMRAADGTTRLRRLLALHVVPLVALEPALGTGTTRLHTLAGECLHVNRIGPVVKVGSGAVVTGQLSGSDGVVYLIDRLLWSPYDARRPCLP